MTWTLIVPEVPPSGNIIKRLHWTRYSDLLERWFFLVRCTDGFLDIPEATGRRRLVIIRRGVRPLDRDNLYASMKPVIDVLRPPKRESGVYKSGKREGQAWTRARIGHGLIQEDDAAHLELVVNQEHLPHGQKPHLVLEFTDLHPG